jgi:hypothetical protein
VGFLNIFKRGGNGAESAPAIQRRSTALTELEKVSAGSDGMTVLNLGPTSSANIAYFTNLGNGIYSEDVITSSADPQWLTETPDGVRFDVERFLQENLVPTGRRFDIVLVWDTFDYIPAELAVPLAKRIFSLTNPGGYLVGFFHSKTGGPPTPYYRYHITGPGQLDLRRGPELEIKQYLNNRKIEEILSDFSSVKFLLARDNMREVLARR